MGVGQDQRASPRPGSLASWWRRINEPRPVRVEVVRRFIAGMMIAYAVLVFTLHADTLSWLIWPRVLVLGYGLAGIVLAGRMRWHQMEAYAIGLAIVLPLSVAYVGANLGASPREVILTGLGLFVMLPFLPSGRSFIAAVVGFVLGQAVIVAFFGRFDMPQPTAWATLLTAAAVGSTVGLRGLTYRGTMRRVNRELAAARDKALDASRLKSEFLASMTHELRTPLNGIIGMTDLLEHSDLDGENRQYVKTVRTSSQNLLALVNDILDFSKIEAGHLRVAQAAQDAQALLEGGNPGGRPLAVARLDVEYHRARAALVERFGLGGDAESLY